MTDAPTIIDLIRNGTMSAEMAATLWAAVDEQRSFVVTAVPRLAGKSTTKEAILALVPPEVPVHRLSGDEMEMVRLKEEATGGYLVVAEFRDRDHPDYLWGAPVRRVFDTMHAGYSLATALHASGLEEAFHDICQVNGVADQDASRIDLLLYIRRFDGRPDTFWRRLAEVHEIDRVEGGRPVGRLLHRWVEGEDRFEVVQPSQLLRDDDKALAARATRLREMAESGRTSTADVARMVAEHPRNPPHVRDLRPSG